MKFKIKHEGKDVGRMTIEGALVFYHCNGDCDFLKSLAGPLFEGHAHVKLHKCTLHQFVALDKHGAAVYDGDKVTRRGHKPQYAVSLWGMELRSGSYSETRAINDTAVIELIKEPADGKEEKA